MKKIEMKNLQNFEYYVDNGNFATIHRCLCQDIPYAYKSFDNEYMLTSILEKIKLIGDLNISGSILPEYLVINNNMVVTYLTKWNESYTLGQYYVKFINNENKDIMISILKNLKKSIINLHNNGIIHGDIHTGNILINQKTNMTSIIDFDNCSYKNFETNKAWCGCEAKDYINRYGVNKELDIFLFNFLTLEIINKIESLKTSEYNLEDISSCFDANDDYKAICDTMVLRAKEPTDKFLIDNYRKVLK